MALIVQKFGGTSVADVERIRNVGNKVIEAKRQGHDIVVVLSAMSGETNRLLEMGRALAVQPNARELDQLAATGEQVTIALLAIYLCDQNVPAISLQGWQIPITTNDIHTKARIEHIAAERIRDTLHEGKVVIVAGFQGVSVDGNVTTLGRGGSDTTAVALAAALEADECQIFTDVDGVYTTDPRIVAEAHRLDRITFEEMLELASQGSKVLQTRSVEFAGKYRVPLRVLSSFSDGPGTLISLEKGMEAPLVSGIACSKQEAHISITGIEDSPRATSSIFSSLSRAHIEVDMITRTPRGAGLTDYCFTVARADLHQARAVLSQAGLSAQALVRDDVSVAKISVIGVALRSHPELSMQLFDALGEAHIAILAITSSELRLSVLVAEQEAEHAVRVLHQAFSL